MPTFELIDNPAFGNCPVACMSGALSSRKNQQLGRFVFDLEFGRNIMFEIACGEDVEEIDTFQFEFVDSGVDFTTRSS